MDLSPDDNPPDDALRQPVRVMQIIHCALMAGVGAFFVFTLLTAGKARAADGDDPFIKLAFGAAAIAAVMSSVVPNVIASGAVKAAARTLAGEGMSADAPARADRLRQSLLAVYQSSHIVGMAILEGAAFFTVFALRFGAPAWFPALTVGLLLVMAIRFPTIPKVADWIAARRAEIDAGLHG